MGTLLKAKDTIIDLDIYLTQSKWAKKHNYKLGTVSQWIKRLKNDEKAGKDIEFVEIEELGIILVKDSSK